MLCLRASIVRGALIFMGLVSGAALAAVEAPKADGLALYQAN